MGGALGAVTRFLIGDAFARRFGTGFPYGTLFINLTGCFLIAFFLGFSRLPETVRYLVPVGFVGAYTTFSTFEYETMRLSQLGQVPAAALYVTLSNALGFVAVLLGSFIARRFG